MPFLARGKVMGDCRIRTCRITVLFCRFWSVRYAYCRSFSITIGRPRLWKTSRRRGSVKKKLRVLQKSVDRHRVRSGFSPRTQTCNGPWQS